MYIYIYNCLIYLIERGYTKYIYERGSVLGDFPLNTIEIYNVITTVVGIDVALYM